MEKYLILIIPLSIVLALAFMWLIQSILNQRHKPYLDENCRNTNLEKVYIYQRGRAPGSYTCFSFKNEGGRWHYVPDKTYIGTWILSYVVTIAICIFVFWKTQILSFKLLILVIPGGAALFAVLIAAEIFLSYRTLIRLLKE
ncbi:MAG: hypothetical protein K6E50_09130 [Lachnospiraceae bacterium]|nr:hypothetical protein [Lachnospiraceae bacterium]